ncbi:MAG: flagellin [Candidatus Ozemobacteraceae bacterium]
MNVSSTVGLFSVNRLNDIESAQNKTTSRIASGKRIVTASDDAAGLSASTALDSVIRGLQGQMANRQDEISLMQTAEGAMSGMNDMIGRINELTVQAANGTLTDEDRKNMQFEVDQLRQQVDQTANNTEYNTKKLFDGSFNTALQNGNDFSIPSMNSAGLGLSNIDLTTQAGANSALSASKEALGTVTSERSRIGAVQNGITSEIKVLAQQLVNTTAAQSTISDADMAQEVINLSREQLQSSVAMSAFKMSAAQRSQVLSILGS